MTPSPSGHVPALLCPASRITPFCVLASLSTRERDSEGVVVAKTLGKQHKTHLKSIGFVGLFLLLASGGRRVAGHQPSEGQHSGPGHLVQASPELASPSCNIFNRQLSPPPHAGPGVGPAGGYHILLLPLAPRLFFCKISRRSDRAGGKAERLNKDLPSVFSFVALPESYDPGRNAESNKW